MKEAKDIKALLDELSKNNEGAFREIFGLYSHKVYSFALRLTGSGVTGEEMVQEVFLRIWLKRESLADVENFSAYLFGITKNLVLNLLKRKTFEEKARIRLLRDVPANHSDTEETVIHHDYEELLKETINHLPPQQKLIYSMCHQEGLQYEDVAQRLKISRFTVKTHMHEALKAIKAQFSHIIQALFLFILPF